jgi:hypothetical protein
MDFLGYKVEKVDANTYKLHGKRTTYTLTRLIHSGFLVASNSKGNQCNIKGNYTFCDCQGTIECVYNGQHFKGHKH